MEELERNSAAAALLRLRSQQFDDKEAKPNLELGSSIGVEIARDEILPVDLLAHCLLQLSSFRDMAMVNLVCKKWRSAMRQSLAYRKRLSFAGCRVDDVSVANLVNQALNLLDLDMSAGTWGCQITDIALVAIADSSCCPNLRSISLWGVTAITDQGVAALVFRAKSLENLNVGGTFITDASLLAIATHCRSLKALNVWGCKFVTEKGLLHLARGCPSLQSLNVFGIKVTNLFFHSLAALNSQLQIKPAPSL
ncbi:hypothetical protein SELMODRAFT_127902 [Selaginella moellendorffii]|uniref:F-box/LRR-repeat protein 15-like leucin rich repeat domain-containing protein n=1 Tax=Selaginella moellendorffii TaxID=88036 RepID=D8SYN9_SELML|nr:F-box protein At5g67140 [Selaginella moellendorffii]EFJ10558.1 hypothetical protein SELMODRAFT_127902 [Selaginella moellendorffii]|eukprot:XP_002988468.1 F-box protein At5g67140 [Selaginella moellendorffii]